MSEKEKKKRRKISPFVGKEDVGPAVKEMPKKPETKPEEYTLFKKLDDITDAIKDLKETLEEKEKGITHQLCRIADAIENKPKDKPIQSRPETTTVPELKPLKLQIKETVPPKTEEKSKIVSAEQPLMKSEPKEEVPSETIQNPTESPANNVEKAKQLFSIELEDLLGFSEEDGYVKIKPLKYLGSDNFAKIAGVIRSAGGEYMSAGRDSHFRLPISSLE